MYKIGGNGWIKVKGSTRRVVPISATNALPAAKPLHFAFSAPTCRVTQAMTVTHRMITITSAFTKSGATVTGHLIEAFTGKLFPTAVSNFNC